MVSTPGLIAVHSVTSISLFINRSMLALEKFDERKQDDESRKMACGDLNGLTRFRQSFLFYSSIKKNTKGGSA